MNKSLSILSLGLSVAIAPPSFAEIEVDDSTMDVIESRDAMPRLGAAAGARDIIQGYMLENGDLTEDEIAADQAEREATRDELRELSESGDTDALGTRVAELREARAANREAIREYIEDNDELADALAEYREEVRENRQERRESIRERIRERREQQSEDQADS